MAIAYYLTDEYDIMARFALLVIQVKWSEGAWYESGTRKRVNIEPGMRLLMLMARFELFVLS